MSDVARQRINTLTRLTAEATSLRAQGDACRTISARLAASPPNNEAEERLVERLQRLLADAGVEYTSKAVTVEERARLLRETIDRSQSMA